jgi:hypothetical protein
MSAPVRNADFDGIEAADIFILGFEIGVLHNQAVHDTSGFTSVIRAENLGRARDILRNHGRTWKERPMKTPQRAVVALDVAETEPRKGLN